jgi:hypothetical protein
MLLVSKKEEKFESSLSKVNISPFPEAILTIDNYFMIQNACTSGMLSIDTDDRNPNYKIGCSVTTNPIMNFPCRRNLFKFEKYGTSNSNIITYGEKILFISHSELLNEPLYLYSTLVSHQSYSRFSRNQEVLAVDEKSYYACWVIEHIDSSIRMAMEGTPVKVSDPFMIRHCSTSRLLASDMVDYFNDYGHEYEVCCSSFQSKNKYQTLVSEKEGRLRIDTKLKTELDQNLWKIVEI